MRANKRTKGIEESCFRVGNRSYTIGVSQSRKQEATGQKVRWFTQGHVSEKPTNFPPEFGRNREREGEQREAKRESLANSKAVSGTSADAGGTGSW